MVKTFIYGDPHGFDFYEKDVDLNDYFKGFYISSRSGRRFVVNRRENGETIYSYLQYNLKEVIPRPTHAFFGMSMVFTENDYCPDFKTLLGFFDTIFEKIVLEKNIFKKNEDGTISYCIHKFINAEEDVLWIKSCLPNIITKFSKTHIEKYDDSFKSGCSGQVVHFGRPVSEAIFLEKLKNYRWVSISADFDNDIIGSPELDELELNYFELKSNLDALNANIVKIISSGNSVELSQIENEVKTISYTIEDYLDKIPKNDEYNEELSKVLELSDSYKSLQNQIESISQKITPSDIYPQTQHCYCCSQDKTFDHFRSSTSTKCLECEQADGFHIEGQSLKECESCHQIKPLSDFYQPSDKVCIDCHFKEEKNDFWSIFDSPKLMKYILIIIAIVVGFVSIFFIASFAKSCQRQDGIPSHESTAESGSERLTSKDDYSNNNVDESVFWSLINNNEIKKAFNHVNGKDNANAYQKPLADAINNLLWKIIENEKNGREDIMYEITRKKIELSDVIQFIGLSDKEFNDLACGLVDDIVELMKVLEKLEITQQDYDNIVPIIRKYPDNIDQGLVDTLKSKIKNSVVTSNSTHKITSPGPIKISYTQPDGKKVEITKKGHCSVSVISGTLVEISYPNGEIKVNGQTVQRKDTYTETFRKTTIVYCGQFGVTIEVRNASPSFNE